MLDQPEKIEAKCPFCHGEEVFMVDIIAACDAPLPTRFAIRARPVGVLGMDIKIKRGGTLTGTNPVPLIPRPSKSGAGDA